MKKKNEKSKTTQTERFRKHEKIAGQFLKKLNGKSFEEISSILVLVERLVREKSIFTSES